jgi:hypothetical protein
MVGILLAAHSFETSAGQCVKRVGAGREADADLCV